MQIVFTHSREINYSPYTLDHPRRRDFTHRRQGKRVRVRARAHRVAVPGFRGRSRQRRTRGDYIGGQTILYRPFASLQCARVLLPAETPLRRDADALAGRHQNGVGLGRSGAAEGARVRDGPRCESQSQGAAHVTG